MKCNRHSEEANSSFSSLDSDVVRSTVEQREQETPFMSMGRQKVTAYSQLSRANQIKEKEAEILSRVRVQLTELRSRTQELEQANKTLKDLAVSQKSKTRLYKEQVQLLKTKVGILQNQAKQNMSMNPKQVPTDGWKESFIGAFLDLVRKLEVKDNITIFKQSDTNDKKKIKSGWRHLKAVIAGLSSRQKSKENERFWSLDLDQ